MVNTVTGQIKITALGMTREEYERRQKEQEEAFWAANLDCYSRIKAFVVSPTGQTFSKIFESVFSGPSDSYSEIFELDKWLPEAKRDEFLSFAMRLQKNEARYPDTKDKLPHPQWEELIENLKKLEY